MFQIGPQSPNLLTEEELLNLFPQSPFSINNNYFLLQNEKEQFNESTEIFQTKKSAVSKSTAPTTSFKWSANNMTMNDNDTKKSSKVCKMVRNVTTPLKMYDYGSKNDATPMFKEMGDISEETFSNYVCRDHSKFKTLKEKENVLDKILFDEVTSKLKLKTPLTIFSTLCSMKLITSEQRGCLKELLFDNNPILMEFICIYECDGDLDKLYDNLNVLLTR